jgi:hypothetical protein
MEMGFLFISRKMVDLNGGELVGSGAFDANRLLNNLCFIG